MEENVTDMLINLDSSKSTSVDNISARMLKAYAYSIAPSLTKLFNLSLTSGTFPRECGKSARIVPTPRLILQVHLLLATNPYLSYQLWVRSWNVTVMWRNSWGFMHHGSSLSALILVYHDWLSSLDSGVEVCIVYFNVKKTFDSVAHIPLLQKLMDLDLNPFLLR